MSLERKPIEAQRCIGDARKARAGRVYSAAIPPSPTVASILGDEMRPASSVVPFEFHLYCVHLTQGLYNAPTRIMNYTTTMVLLQSYAVLLASFGSPKR
jgi:hypothetical protein